MITPMNGINRKSHIFTMLEVFVDEMKQNFVIETSKKSPKMGLSSM
jgi:hypothetical protein